MYRTSNLPNTRIDVADENHPGPFLPYQEALAGIQKILQEGFDELRQAGLSE